MRRLTSAAIITVLFSLIVLPTLAYADCASDIDAVEKRIEFSGGAKTTEGQVRAVRKVVEKAKQALAEGQKKKCKNLIEKAQKKIVNNKL